MSSRGGRYGGEVDLVRKEIIAADGTTLSYEVAAGAEPTVVFLHGLAGSGREFEETARAMIGRRAILVDQRGHGHSTRRPRDTSRDAFVADAARVIAAESGRPVDLVGQSMGAHTAMLLAAAHPSLLRRLVLLECDAGGTASNEHLGLEDYLRSWPVPFPDRAAAAEWIGGGPLARAWASDLEERDAGLYPRFDAGVMGEVMSTLAAPRWQEWDRVCAPTLVVYAEKGMFSEDQKTEFLSHGRNVRRIDLAGASHDAHLDAFEAWVAALTSFLTPH